MTALCGGGTSSAQPGFGASVVLTASSLAAFLTAVPLPWAAALAGYLGLVSYDLTTFCMTDPPTYVVPDASDALALLTLDDYAAHLAAVTKFENFFANFLWPQFCKCDSGPQPSPPTPPAEPTGFPSINPPSLAPCWQASAHYVFPGTSSNANHFLPQLLPGGSVSTCVALTSIPQGNVQLTITVNADGTTNGSAILALSGFDGSSCGGLEKGGGQTALTAPGATTTVAVPWWPSAGSGFAFVNANTATADNSVDVTVSFNCLSTGVVSQVPCCPGDPLDSAAINQILNLVTIIQRQMVPFAYIASTAHAGLTDQGTLSVASLVGIKIELTTVPTHFGQALGSPTVYFDVGWVSILTADGIIEERRIRALETVWTPRSMSEATVVGYSFSSGIVATITELEREP